MDAEELIAKTMPLPSGWRVTRAEVRDGEKVVDIYVSFVQNEGPCPECGISSRAYDTRRRTWRHLDLLEHQAWIVCDVPRVDCPEHGVGQIHVPWADAYSRFTERFECRVIDWLREASMSAVARNLGLTWDQVAGIQQRAVARGLQRRESVQPRRIGIDETSFQRRHEYVSIVSDIDEGRVLYVADGRGQASIDPFFEALTANQLERVEVVAMDMHDPFINSAAWHVPGIETKLCFDRFHVAQLLGNAVDVTRRAESKRLADAGDESLKGTKYLWLKNPESLPALLRRRLGELRDSSLQVAEVWAIKDAARSLWHYRSRTWAKKAWTGLCDWAESTAIPAARKVAKTLRYYMLGIVNAVVHRVTNASSESINARVQALKKRANGYRNRARFRSAIYFHLGGLDLYPRPSTHTNP